MSHRIPMTIAAYAALVKKSRRRVKRWMDEYPPGTTLPGGGVIMREPDGTRWIEVLPPKDAEAAP